eukprot:8092280-Alexandrium_andersonii.AAC.1
MFLPAPRSGVPVDPRHRPHSGLCYGGIGLHCQWGQKRVLATVERHLDPQGRGARDVALLWGEAEESFYETASWVNRLAP